MAIGDLIAGVSHTVRRTDGSDRTGPHITALVYGESKVSWLVLSKHTGSLRTTRIMKDRAKVVASADSERAQAFNRGLSLVQPSVLERPGVVARARSSIDQAQSAAKSSRAQAGVASVNRSASSASAGSTGSS